jgi:hypothetical protein
MNETQVQELNHILGACLSSDNGTRTQGEQAVSQHISSNRDAFVFGLVRLLRTSSVTQVRTLCAIILRQKLTEGHPVLFDTLDAELQQTVKSELLNGPAIPLLCAL